MNTLDSETLNYHQRQWEKPYYSTLAFAELIRGLIESGDTVLDIGCGGGAATSYLAREFTQAKFTGLDILSEPITLAQSRDSLAGFRIGDAMMQRDFYNGVIGVQFLHTLPSYSPTLFSIARNIKPDWMAFSTLLYDGEIECQTRVWEPKIKRASWYNVLSVPIMRNRMLKEGYKLTKYEPFYIPEALPEPEDKDMMKTYTADGRQFSGPLHMPWGFIAFERIA